MAFSWEDINWGNVAQGVGGLLGGYLGSRGTDADLQPVTSPWYRETVPALYDVAAGVAERPFEYYPYQRYEGMNQDQTDALGMVRSNLGLGSGAVNAGISGAQAAMGYTPQNVSGNYTAGGLTAPQVSANYNPSSIQAQELSGSYNYKPMMVGSGGVTAERIAEERIGSKNFTDYDINKYMNPYISGVIDTSLSDIERARQETENAQKADMMAAGAWGGSRSGVAQALTNREYANTAASTAANLRARGFDTAASLIGQDANRLLTADQSNQAANLAAKQSNQATSLAASQTNASLALQAALANQAAGMNNAQFGANFGLQQGMANQGANLQAQLANLQSSQFGANLGLNAGLANQDAAMRAGLANMQDRQFGANLGMNAGLANQAAGLEANRQRLYGANQLGQLGMLQNSMGANDAQMLMNAGNFRQAQSQLPLDFAYNQWLAEQGWDQGQLGFLRGFLTDPYGGAMMSGTQGNPYLGALGGALTGSQIFGDIYNAWRQPQTAPSPFDSYDSYSDRDY